MTGCAPKALQAMNIFDVFTARVVSILQSLAERGAVPAGIDLSRVVVEPPRDELHRRINARVDRMIDEGAIEEVRALLALDLDREAPAMKAIGVREIGELISGRASINETKDRLKAATRQYAKRQSTWFRHQTGEGWRKA